MGLLSVWAAGFVVLLMVFEGLASPETRTMSFRSVCPLKSLKDSIFMGFHQDLACPLDGIQSSYMAGVIQGDELSLQRALNMIHRNTHDYVALLFYASWCPFSGSCRPKFSVLSSLFPSIPHFAIEESAVKPSTLSKYGVHGFPTLFLLNSTMRIRYHGSRTLDSLIEFYSGTTGFQIASVDDTSLGKTRCSSNHLKLHGSDQENCPFSWARSPENLLQQETYLALATAFVLMRLLYKLFPALRKIAHFSWERSNLHIRIRSLWELPLLYLNRAIQLCNSLQEPCKRSNLQEGAMNAKAWASKSLASVSFGESSTSRVVPLSSTN
ncbi:PREDICTED: 5'-adenylylsulfate reductase-like 4 [Nicotiana attenuata]|uniref:5'-adenylylsulfate reductase-like 4 n=1 Tax=Nicotiana attenuata TaxID=49451 RepID=A0A1J6IKV5_NICAT|nr:PREDICTED: 5'-adenylylsulfate reductase-like 4 [Nicotiana attenuata]OIS99514.1 5'-adenylylsulfate reductase-like 4 [Nicotiana attenuata]